MYPVGYFGEELKMEVCQIRAVIFACFTAVPPCEIKITRDYKISMLSLAENTRKKGKIVFDMCTIHVSTSMRSISVLSVRFELGVSLLLAPTRAQGPFSSSRNVGIQPVIRKRVPAGAPAGAWSY